MKAMFIKSRVDFLYFFSKIIILIFFGLPDKSQCSQYSERMDSKSCSRVLYQQNLGYDKVLLFSQSQWGPRFQRKGLGKESTVTYNERWTDQKIIQNVLTLCIPSLCRAINSKEVLNSLKIRHKAE